MNRPLHVVQRENDRGFWWVHKGRNGKVVAVSEMFPTRRNAIRAARSFIAHIDPVQVVFTYWSGPHPRNDPRGTLRQHHSELIR